MDIFVWQAIRMSVTRSACQVLSCSPAGLTIHITLTYGVHQDQRYEGLALPRNPSLFYLLVNCRSLSHLGWILTTLGATGH